MHRSWVGLAGAIALLTSGVAHAHPLQKGGPESQIDLSAEPAMARAAQVAPEPPIVATPRAQCNDKARPEPSIQGRIPKEEVDSGRAAKGYWCNLEVIGKSGNTGGFRVHRYIDKSGREC